MNPCILYYKVVMVPRTSVMSDSEISITVLCLLCSQQELFEKSMSVIKIATMKNAYNFHYTKKAIMCNHQINTFHCQQR